MKTPPRPTDAAAPPKAGARHTAPSGRRRARSAIAVTTGLAAGAAILTGCGGGDPDWLGAAGVSVTAHGDPLIVFAVCSQHIDQVTVWDATNSSTSEQSNWQYDRTTPLTGTGRLNLAHPGTGWQRHDPLTLRPNAQYAVLGVRKDKDAEVSQVTFDTRALANLRPGTVYTNRDATTAKLTPAGSVRDFASRTCRS